jgi:hypothetical protein
MLKPFAITPGTIRLDTGNTPKGYHLAAFEDTFARYLPPLKTPQRHVSEI